MCGRAQKLLAALGAVLPMMRGMPERRTDGYLRHGITNLFAAFTIADATRRSSSRSS
jgi:hypothetical protein